MESKTNKYHLSQQKHFYHLKCKLCMYETHIAKTINDHVHGFKKRMNNNITEKGAYCANSPFTILIAA